MPYSCPYCIYAFALDCYEVSYVYCTVVLVWVKGKKLILQPYNTLVLRNVAVTSQYSYDVCHIVLALYTERILYLIDDISMMLQVADTWL